MAIKLPKHIEKKLLKEAKKNNGRISAKEYNAIVLEAEKKTKTFNSYEFDFIFDCQKISDSEFKFTLVGKHLSTNRINSLPFRQKIRYKSAIKKAAENFFLINRGVLPKKTFKKAVIVPTAFNPKSRDDDGNSITLKILRDLMTNYNFIKDDSREYLIEEPCKEEISKEYKIEWILREE